MLIALVMLLLFEPRLTVQTEEPIRGSVAVLLDNSKSMLIDDLREGSRAAKANALFHPQQGTLAKTLNERFDVQFFTYGERLTSLTSTPSFASNTSQLGSALNELTHHASAPKLASVIIVGDGKCRHTEHGSLRPCLIIKVSQFRFTHVMVGREVFAKDIEIAHVSLPRHVLRGTNVVADVTIAHTGFGDQTVDVVVEEDDAIINQVSAQLTGDTGRTNVAIALRLDSPGPRQFKFRIPVSAEERLPHNNQMSRAIDVRSEPLRVLHLEGEPRFEVKFLRRALRADPGLELVSLVRTAENKYYRLGIRNKDELANGFPTSESSLYQYDIVVLGNVDSSLLTKPQLALLKRFVAKRGGGLVVLGGRVAYSAGGYTGSSLADILPG